MSDKPMTREVVCGIRLRVCDVVPADEAWLTDGRQLIRLVGLGTGMDA